MAEAILTGLQSTMDNLATAIANQGVGTLIENFNGDALKFKEWLRQIDKYALMNNLDDAKQIKIAFMTSKGAVSDYIFRWQKEIEAERNTWENLKHDLTARFSAITDANHAHALLRQIKQKHNEPVTLYSERLYTMAQEAYANMNINEPASKAIVQRQLIDYFIDGLNNDGIKFKIMRESPRTLEDAIRTAMGEQNLRKRFALRNNKTTYEERETPMDVDHARRQRCRHCNLTNHTSQNCRNRQVNEVQSGAGQNQYFNNQIRLNQQDERKRCYYCGSYTHFRRNCEKYIQDMRMKHPRQNKSQYSEN